MFQPSYQSEENFDFKFLNCSSFFVKQPVHTWTNCWSASLTTPEDYRMVFYYLQTSVSYDSLVLAILLISVIQKMFCKFN